MQHLDFCTQILELSAPWQVDSIEIDQPSRRLDIFIGFDTSRKKSRFSILPPTGLFGFSRPPTCPHCHSSLPQGNSFETVCLRHLPIAGMQTFLHVPAPGTVQSRQPNCFCMRRWAASGTVFTEAMRDYVLTILRAAPDAKSAAQLAGISYSEVRQICQASDFTSISPEQQNSNTASHQAAAAGFGSTAHDIKAVPDENHPGWARLVNGELTIKADSIALRMLMQRVHADREKGMDIQAQRTWIRLLRSFFLKNRQLLKNEIEMLHNSEAASSTMPGESGDNGILPAEGEPVWQALINGEVILPNDSVSLKMMLTRVRQVITRNPTDANRREGARALRQYFMKNQHRLASDIRCLKQDENEGKRRLPADNAPDCLVPSIAHPGWQRLIDGEIQIETDSVALRMLLVQIRQSLEKNQGVSRKLACTKLLRNYFLKHQNRHRQDLEKLGAS